MSFLSTLKRKFSRKRRTYSAGFHDYRSSNRIASRKPIKAKNPSRFKGGNSIKILKFFFVLIFLGLVLYLLLFSKTFEIQGVGVTSDNESISTEKDAVLEYLQGQLGKNLLFFNTSKHSETILTSYPNLKDLKIKRKLFHSLQVELQSYEDKANLLISHDSGEEYLLVINELGVISGVAISKENLPDIFFNAEGTELTVDITKPESLMGQKLMDQKVLNSLLDSRTLFEQKFNIKIIELSYLQRAREIHLLTEKDFYVWLDLEQDIEAQLNKLKKASTELNIYTSPLSYIDLRISGQNGEKVIYKFK